MQVSVKHSLPGRLRLLYDKNKYTSKQALLAQTLITVQEGILDTNCNTNIGSFLIYYDIHIVKENDVLNLFHALTGKYLEDPELLKNVDQIPETESIESVLIETLAIHYLKKWFLPLPVRTFLLWKSLLERCFHVLSKFAESKRLFSTELLDATAITVATLTGNKNTASQINLLLNIGEEIEEITKLYK